MKNNDFIKLLPYVTLGLYLALLMIACVDSKQAVKREGSALEKPYKELQFNTLINPYKLNDHTTFLELIFNPLFNGLENHSKGSLRTKYYIANELTPAPEIYNSVIKGTADMGFNVVWRHETDRYPVSCVFH